MLYENYVGIDVSKLSIDAFIRESRIHRRFKNEESGFKQLIQWIKEHIGESWESLLICFEHTGLFSLSLALFHLSFYRQKKQFLCEVYLPMFQKDFP